MNKIAVKLCANELISAKELLDELLEIKELKLIASDITSESLIPSYLIKTLIYFFLKTSKRSDFNFCREFQDGQTVGEESKVYVGHELHRAATKPVRSHENQSASTAAVCEPEFYMIKN